MTHSTISLGLGLGGGKAATSSGRPAGGGSFVNEKSVLFDGADDMADSGSAFNSIWSGSFSISFWYKSPSPLPTAGTYGTTLAFLGNDFVASKGYIEFRYNSTTADQGKMQLFFSPSASNNSAVYYNLYGASPSTFRLSANTWYHLCWVADRPGTGTTSSTLYVNGNAETLSGISGYLSTIHNAGGTFDNNTLIAARNNASSGSGSGELYLDGHLDEMAFFNSALSSSDVTSIYNSGAPADLTDLSPSHWWRFGDGTEAGSGTTVYDMAGSTNLTLTNGPTYSTDVPS